MAYTNKIIFYHGQSNDNGRVPMAQLPVAKSGYLYNVKVWDGTTFKALNADEKNNNQYDEVLNFFGSEMWLNEYATTLGRDVYLVKFSHGGTRMTDTVSTASWNTSVVGSRFDVAKGIIDDVKTWMDDRGKLYKPEIVRFTQGEADCNTPLMNAGDVTIGNWKTDFIAMKNAYNTHINTAMGSTPLWVLAPLSPNIFRAGEWETADVSNVRTQQLSTITDEADVYGIDTSDITVIVGDGVHYDLAGMQTIGERCNTLYGQLITP